MKGEIVQYDGRAVPKEGFRVFIYGFDNQTKLVESWEEYQKCISSGLWFCYKDAPQLIKTLVIDAGKDKKQVRK